MKNKFKNILLFSSILGLGAITASSIALTSCSNVEDSTPSIETNPDNSGNSNSGNNNSENSNSGTGNSNSGNNNSGNSNSGTGNNNSVNNNQLSHIFVFYSTLIIYFSSNSRYYIFILLSYTSY